jgi:hypothetical protein
VVSVFLMDALAWNKGLESKGRGGHAGWPTSDVRVKAQAGALRAVKPSRPDMPWWPVPS